MADVEAENEQVVAHREVVERLWTVPLIDAAGELFPFPAESTVLILSARCGYVPLYFHEHLPDDSRIIAVEHNRDFLDEARERADQAGVERIFFVGQRSTDLSYADDVFKGAVCVDGLITSRQVSESVAEMTRVVSKGGLVAVATPLGTSFPEFYDMLDEALRHLELGHVRERIDELKESLMSSARLLRVARDSRLVGIEINEVEWEVTFESGLDFLHSPLVRETFFPHWIGIIRSSEREAVLRYIADAVDTYWHDRDFSTLVRAAVLTGSVS